MCIAMAEPRPYSACETKHVLNTKEKAHDEASLDCNDADGDCGAMCFADDVRSLHGYGRAA